jgi:hypothetical protein
MPDQYNANQYQVRNFLRTRLIRIGVLLLALTGLSCACLTVWFYNLDSPDEKSGSEKAEKILLAIRDYKEKEFSFPATLNDLTPDYISFIPKPDLRQYYCYDRRADRQSFTLAFVPRGEAIGDGYYVYSSILNKWTRVDSDFWGECSFRFDLLINN